MYLRIITLNRAGITYRYAQIVEHVVENGKHRIRVIKHLGPVTSASDLDKYNKMLADEKAASTIYDLNRFVLLEPKIFGPVYASLEIAKKYGIYKILRKIFGKDTDLMMLMIVSRLIDPSSDIRILEFIRKSYLNIDANKNMIYRSLDTLESKKEEIELGIFRAIRPDTSKVFYDLTSSYFEGTENNDLVLFGYSRDKKRGKEQIVIAVVMADGIPIYHEVYPGNTVDPSTLENTIRVLKEKFQIKDVIFVEDRAFGRKPSLKILDENQYITAAYRWDQPYRGVLMNTAVTEEDKVEDLYIKEVSIKASNKDQPEEAKKGKRRYIFVYNPDREKQDLEDLDIKIEAVEKILTERLGKEETKNKLGNLRSLVSFKGNEIKLNEKKIKEIKGLAGRYLIITNSSLGKEEAVKTYKDLWKIERAFRTIKSFIEIRPIYHRKTERIRAHVFISVLSLLIGRIIEKKTGKSISRVMDILSGMEAIPVKIGDKIITIRNESEECKEILNDLNIKYPDRVL